MCWLRMLCKRHTGLVRVKQYLNYGMLLILKIYVREKKESLNYFLQLQLTGVSLRTLVKCTKTDWRKRKSPHRRCCPPGWRGAAGGCCAAAVGRTAYGGEGQARPAGCALCAPLRSPCAPWGPARRRRRRLCVDASAVNGKQKQ